MTLKDTRPATFSQALAAGPVRSGSPDGTTLDLFGPAPAPASRSARRGSGRASKTNATSGPSFDASSPSASQTLFSGSRSPAPTEENGLQAARVCSGCAIEKPLSEFYRSETSLMGYRTRCKECCRSDEASRKARIPKAVRSADHQKWRRQNRGSALVRLAAHRAKMKGLPCTISAGAIQSMIDRGECQMTGIPFNLDGGRTWDSPSLDRIDNSQGYTPENTRVVLYALNVMANTWGERKIIEIAEAIMARRRSASAVLQSRLESALKRRLSLNNSPEYALTWKDWPMQSGPPICALRASGRRTSASGCGGWPTPMAGSPGTDTYNPAGNTDSSRRTVELVSGWPTPTSNNLTGAGTQGREGGENLQTAAKLSSWNTPRATDGSNGGPNQAGGALPADAATAGWATPTTRDHKDGGATSVQNVPVNALLGRQAHLSGDQQNGSPAPTENRGALSPAFSLWLMGYPPEWESCAPLAMRSSRRSRRNSSAPGSTPDPET